jgi:hypothetical protein
LRRFRSASRSESYGICSFLSRQQGTFQPSQGWLSSYDKWRITYEKENPIVFSRYNCFVADSLWKRAVSRAYSTVTITPYASTLCNVAAAHVNNHAGYGNIATNRNTVAGDHSHTNVCGGQ